ncbi:MAG: DUF3313 domain-containing protein [Candidatus Auribacterota bacterium]
MRKSFILLILCGVAATIALNGCKAGVGKNAGFVDPSVMEKRADLPFHKAWIKEGLDKSTYDSVYIAPVSTQYLIVENNWWREMFRYHQIQQDAEKVAVFTREAFIKAFKEDPNHRFEVVDEPRENTFIVELAIIELTPNNPFLKAGSYAPFGIGAGVSLINSTNLSTVAFEARIRDGSTGETVAMFADREQEKKYIVTDKHLTWYGHAEDIIDDWALQFVALGNRVPGDIISDTKTFELKPW